MSVIVDIDWAVIVSNQRGPYRPYNNVSENASEYKRESIREESCREIA